MATPLQELERLSHYYYSVLRSSTRTKFNSRTHIFCYRLNSLKVWTCGRRCRAPWQLFNKPVAADGPSTRSGVLSRARFPASFSLNDAPYIPDLLLYFLSFFYFHDASAKCMIPRIDLLLGARLIDGELTHTKKTWLLRRGHRACPRASRLGPFSL